MKTRKLFIVLFLCLSIGIYGAGCKKKTEEEKGKEITEKKIGYVKGVGEGLKEKGESAGESIGEGLSKTIKGIGKGVDKAFEIDVRPNQKLQASGIKVTKAQTFMRDKEGEKKTGEKEKGISVYIICEKGLNERLLLKAFDGKDEEIGRSSAKSDLKDAGYIDFIFDDRVQLSDASYFTMEEIVTTPSKN